MVWKLAALRVGYLGLLKESLTGMLMVDLLGMLLERWRDNSMVLR